MPMQATTTMPLFSAALRPDRSPRIVGGWVALAVATVLATPLAVLVPDMLLPTVAAFVAGFAGMAFLTWKEAQQRQLTQEVTLWPDQLEIVTRTGKNQRVLRRFDPKAVRLLLQRDHNEKALAMRLRAGTDELEIGAFLSAEDKSSFAKAFGTALRRARQQA